MSRREGARAGGAARAGTPADGRGPVRAVVFDLGNVVVHWDPTLPFAGVLSPEDLDAFFAEIDFPARNAAHDGGRPWQESRDELRARDARLADLLEVYLERFPLSLAGPVPGTAELIADLRAAGLRVLGLTNWSRELYPHALPAAPAIGLLEGVLVSGQEGVAKPDPRVFALLVQRYGLDPATTVFTDDSAPNVRAASAAGLDGILFTGAAALRAELLARGVEVPAR